MEAAKLDLLTVFGGGAGFLLEHLDEIIWQTNDLARCVVQPIYAPVFVSETFLA